MLWEPWLSIYIGGDHDVSNYRWDISYSLVDWVLLDQSFSKYVKSGYKVFKMKWEYEIISDISDRPIKDVLNYWGDQGWELVSIEWHGKGVVLTFKRPKEKNE